jgi:hypothetical protein
MKRTKNDQHPKTSCFDGVQVSRRDILYPQPERLFLSPKGCLDITRFNELLLEVEQSPPTTLSMRNFTLLRNLIWSDSINGLCQHKLDKHNISIASDDDRLKYQAWITNRKNKKQRVSIE